MDTPDNDIKIDGQGNLLVAEHVELIQQQIADALGVSIGLLSDEDNPESRAATAIEHHQTEINASIELMTAGLESYLKSLLTNHAIEEWGLDDTWLIQGYTLDKHGIAYWQMLGEDGKHKTEKVKGRRFGPHRPRRHMRAYLRLHIGNINIEYHIQPIIPLKFVTIDLTVTSPEGTVDTVKATVGPLATDAEAQDTLDYFETLKDDAQKNDPPAE